MTQQERSILEELAAAARSLFARGYSFGTAGNISARLGQRVFISPTNSSFARLAADALAEVDLEGQAAGPLTPSKEVHFHLAVYRARPQAGAVVHLHSTHATALACLRDLNLDDALPVLTPYYAMRLPCLPVAPYHPPGDPLLAPEVAARAVLSPALLLRHHGLIACGPTVAEAAALAEEIEEQARLFFLLGERAQPLTAGQVAALRAKFK
ncbi:MAG: aldolase [Acidobacteria bacterium]|nr:aldolase [Acidobacteriota bacterium]